MHLTLARVVLVLCAVPLVGVVIVAGLIAGPFVAVAWLNQEVKKAWFA